MSRSLVVLGLVSLAVNGGISEASSPGIATYQIVSRISAPDLSMSKIRRRLQLLTLISVLSVRASTYQVARNPVDLRTPRRDQFLSACSNGVMTVLWSWSAGFSIARLGFAYTHTANSRLRDRRTHSRAVRYLGAGTRGIALIFLVILNIHGEI